MLFRNPTHTSAYALPGGSIQYSSPLISSTVPGPQTTPPSPALQTYIPPTVDGTAVLAGPEPTAIPGATFQYAVPPLAAQPIQFQQIEYNPQPLHNAQFYPFSSPFDIYNSLHIHKQPTSLLDSYIPSSVILAAQRQRNAALAHRQHSHPLVNSQFSHSLTNSFPAPSLSHPTTFYHQGSHQGSHQPGYNTIAYSTAQGYSKRSPKLVSERPLKLTKVN